MELCLNLKKKLIKEVNSSPFFACSFYVFENNFLRSANRHLWLLIDNEKGLVKSNHLDTWLFLTTCTTNFMLHWVISRNKKYCFYPWMGPTMIGESFKQLQKGKGMDWFIEYWKSWASFNTCCVQIRSEGKKCFELNVENISWQSFPKENIYKNHKNWEIFFHLQFYNSRFIL